MDFTPQHVMELIQDPLVLVLVLVGVLLGVVLGRIGSRHTAKTLQHSESRPTGTPPRQVDGASGAGSRPGSPASTPKPAVPETPQPAPPLPDPVPVKPTPVPAAEPRSPEPVRQETPVPVAGPKQPAGPMAEAVIHTRTGANPSKAKLIDPHAESERVWSKGETARAVALYRSGKSLVPIALAMKIDQRQVAIRLIRVLFAFDGELEDMKAAPRHGMKYSDEEVSKMQSYSDAGSSIQDIAMAVERTVLGVGWRMLDRRMI